VLERATAALLGGPLLLVILHEAYFQSFGFYAEHWTIPTEKYGVRMALRWQDIVFLVFIWPILLTLFYVSCRLLKYAFRRKRVRTSV